MLLKQRGSMHGALVGYNGSTAYADAVIKLQKVWHTRLEGHASGGAASGRPRQRQSRGQAAARTPPASRGPSA